MTGLEQHLLTAFERLSKQYSEDMSRLEAQNSRLRRQVEQLSEQVQRLSEQHQQVIAALNEEYST